MISPAQRAVLASAVNGVLPDPTGPGKVAVYRALLRRGVITYRDAPHPSGDTSLPWRRYELA